MNQVLQSLRLNFRLCTDADVDLLLSHWTQPMVRRYLFDDRIIDRQTVEQFVTSSSTSFAKYGYGLWILTNKTDGEFQGVCGLYLFDETQQKPDLVYSIATPYWGQGLATQSARCVLEYAFEAIKLPQIIATVDKPNIESVRVLEKLGMSLLQEQIINENPILRYSLAADDYRKEPRVTPS